MKFLKEQKYLILVIGVVLVILIFGRFWLQNHNNGTFKGTVTRQDNCFVLAGTSQCTWVVGDRKVELRGGSASGNGKTGDIQGFGLQDNIVGKKVEVKGSKNGTNNYLLSEPTDYIKLLD